MSKNQAIAEAAKVILEDFDEFHIEFKSLTRKAAGIFANRTWKEGQELAVTRLDLYKVYVVRSEAKLMEILKKDFKGSGKKYCSSFS